MTEISDEQKAKLKSAADALQKTANPKNKMNPGMAAAMDAIAKQFPGAKITGSPEERKAARDEMLKKREKERAELRAKLDKEAADADKERTMRILKDPQAMDDYISKLKNHDWYYDMSDDHKVWKQGSDAHKEIMRLKKVLDPDGKIYNKYSPK